MTARARCHRLLPLRAALSLALLFAALLSGLLPAMAAQPQFPALTGRVVDEAGLLSREEADALARQLEALEERTSDQLVVVTLRSLQGFPIEDYGYKLGRHWGIGQAGKDNGVLLIVAPTERKVRIEVGRGLEGELPDALAKLIIENAILPRFRAGDFAGGIRDGVRDITAVLTGDAEAVKLRARPPDNALPDWVAIVIILAWFIIFTLVIWSIVHSARSNAKAGGRKGKKGGWLFGPGSSSGGGWSGGGGFSGGGGSFGGGGASGSW